MWGSSRGTCTFTGEILTKPIEFARMESQANLDMNDYVGFQHFDLKIQEDSAVATDSDNRVGEEEEEEEQTTSSTDPATEGASSEDEESRVRSEYIEEDSMAKRKTDNAGAKYTKKKRRKKDIRVEKTQGTRHDGIYENFTVSAKWVAMTKEERQPYLDEETRQKAIYLENRVMFTKENGEEMDDDDDQYDDDDHDLSGVETPIRRNTIGTTRKPRASKPKAAENVLHVREALLRNPENQLGKLYLSDSMPSALSDAHRDLDAAVEACYRKELFRSDNERVMHLNMLLLKGKNNPPMSAAGASSSSRSRKKQRTGY
eukprot:g902.t1